MTCLYVSPHPDDVALSCAGGLLRRRARRERVVVCSVFTEGPDRALRLAEDSAALNASGCEVVHLGFADAPAREAIAPSFRSLVLEARVRPELVEHLTRALQALIDEIRPREVWAPLGVGGHVDHVTTFEAARRLSVATRFYEDRPYAFVPWLRELRRLELEGGAAPVRASALEIALAFESGACGALLGGDERDACCIALAEALATPHSGQGASLQARAHRRSAAELDPAAALIERYASQTRWLFGQQRVASLWQRLAGTSEGWFESEAVLAPR